MALQTLRSLYEAGREDDHQMASRLGIDTGMPSAGNLAPFTA
jgi:hypothetical protein